MREMLATWKRLVSIVYEQSSKTLSERHPKNKIGKGYEQAVQFTTWKNAQ